MKACCLVVVRGGVAYTYQPEHVDCRSVDLDMNESGGTLEEIPRGVGFEELVREAAMRPGQDFEWAE